MPNDCARFCAHPSKWCNAQIRLHPVPATNNRNAVRIIGGAWKRSVITFADADGLRPTPDRVRETLFNWLGQDLSGLAVLDCFAGTGALALEAASRGAARVLALDTNANAVRSIAEHAKRLKDDGRVEVRRNDAIAALRTYGATFDIIFCDPPFAADEIYRALETHAPAALKPGGFLYLESAREYETFGSLTRVKHMRAGAVHAHLFQKG
jgi:16S rRNA (guanine966-N2)-methyltransferase